MRHRLLATMILAALAVAMPWNTLGAALPARTARPNMVFFLADDLGYMDIGANNPKTFYSTPRIDSIAAAGMRFTAGYAACPVCSPTRASIMTGKYPARTGITDYIGGHRAAKLLPAPNKDHLALEEVTLGEALRDAGYTNFFAGKWHLGRGEYSPNAQGFGPGLVGQGQFYYPPSNQPPLDPKDDPKTSDRIADEAVRFIDANADKPFFAYLPFLAVHNPVGARPGLVEKYRQKPAPPEAWGKERQSEVRLVQSNPVYAAMLEQLDSAIGRVLDAIERQHLGERTIVIFMSDNGGLSTSEGHPTSNLPLRGGKGWPYEGGIREPWIIRAPGITRPGSVCDIAVTSTDFYPTLLELAGMPLNPKQHCDGVSLLPLLRGGWIERGPLFWHYPHYGNQGGAPCGAVREGDWKVIEWYEDSRLELFNLRDDPGEKHNLAAVNPDKARELQAKLAAWRGSVKALMPTANPDPGGQPAAPKASKKRIPAYQDPVATAPIITPQPQTLRPQVRVIENGESKAKPEDCRGIIVGPGINQPDPFPGYGGFVGWESPIRLQNGDWLVGFNAGYWHASAPTPLRYPAKSLNEYRRMGLPADIVAPTGGRAMLTRSTDQGKTWSKPETLIDTPADDRHPAFLQLPDGTVLCCFFTYPGESETGDLTKEPEMATRVNLIRSFDGGRTWEKQPRVLKTPFLSDETDGPMVRLKDGSVVIAMDGRPMSGPPEQAGLLRSTDRGATWQWLSTVKTDHDLFEVTVAELPDGRLVMMARPEGDIWWSSDHGRTWTAPVTFGMRLFAPSLYVLRDGTLVCLHGSYAPGHPGLRVIFSRDGGQTWIAPAKDHGFLVDTSYGYGKAMELPDGSLFISYLATGGHATTDAQQNAIRCIRLHVRADHSGIDLLPAPNR